MPPFDLLPNPSPSPDPEAEVMSDGNHCQTAARCKICQARSTGIHYGVQSCEGCKAFFKRGMIKKSSYKCYFGRACDVTPKTRSRCKACRLQKCLNEGMSIEGAKGRISKPFKDFTTASHTKKSAMASATNITERMYGTRSEPMSVTSEEKRDSEDNSGSSDNLDLLIRTGTFGTPSVPLIQSVPSRLSVIRCVSSLNALEMEALSHSGGSRIQKSTAAGELNQATNTAALHNLLENSLVVSHPFGGGVIPGMNTKLDLNLDVQAPSFLAHYWTIMKERNNSLESSIKSITEAVKTVYWDQIDDWTKFMMKAVTFGEVPVQPQTTLDTMQRYFQTNIYDEVVRSVQFTALMPGFTDLPQPEQSACIGERGFHIWLVRHAPFVKNGELYRLTAEGDLHYCRYWLNMLLEPEFLDFILDFAQEFNALQLTLAESYVFLATALFWPEPAEESKATYSNLLYVHYLDALVSMIGPKRGSILEKLQEMIGQFGTLKKIQAAYCLTMDVSQVPYRSSAGVSFDIIRRKSAA